MPPLQQQCRGGKGGGMPMSRGAGKGGAGRGRSSPHAKAGGHPDQMEALSRELSTLLRHRGLPEMRPDGYAPVAAVIAALRSHPQRSDVKEVVRLSRRGDAPRFELLHEGADEWIRATDKRSIGQQSNSTNTVPLPESSLRQAPAAEDATRRISPREIVGVASKDFDSSKYGSGYLSLREGEQIILCRDMEEDAGWAFGKKSSIDCPVEGWFPAAFWKPLVKSSPAGSSSQGLPAHGDSVPPLHMVPDEVCEQDDQAKLRSDLQLARAEILELQSELARERSVAADLRRQLCLALSRQTSLNFEGKHNSQQNVDASVTQHSLVEGSDKERLLAFLSQAFPNIRNEGLRYEITDRFNDAKGSAKWRARADFKELQMECFGEYCSSKSEAEQSAALKLLHQLGGLASGDVCGSQAM